MGCEREREERVERRRETVFRVNYRFPERSPISTGTLVRIVARSRVTGEGILPNQKFECYFLPSFPDEKTVQKEWKKERKRHQTEEYTKEKER